MSKFANFLRGLHIGDSATASAPLAGAEPGTILHNIAAGEAQVWDGTKAYPHGLPGWLEAPRLSVTPQVSGSPQAAREFGDGAVEMAYLRYTVNADDDVVAGSRLLNGYAGVGMLLFDSQTTVRSSSAITRIDVVAASVDEPGTAAAGVPAALNPAKTRSTESTEAQVRTSMVTFTFDSADNVLVAVLTLSQLYADAASPATAAQWATLHVEGRSHA